MTYSIKNRAEVFDGKSATKKVFVGTIAGCSCKLN